MAQCNTLRSQIDITFNTDQDCAPTEVTDFTITYYFNTSQNPADIGILFEWNNPGNNTTFVAQGNPDFNSANADTEFTATAEFMYPENDNCSFFPTAYVFIDGVQCPTSEQIQTAFSWARDNEFGGQIAIAPEFYDVCYDDAVVNAVFADDSFFNCNPIIEPDNPNRQTRNVQFVYGNAATHNPANTIVDLSLEDGGAQPLTDGAGNLASTTTRGTAGLPITAAYFGPVETIPFPADAPISVTFPMNAPANAANAVGNLFEITLFNWNVCNPYNGDPVNPNYEDAVSTTAYIRIIDAPTPDFVTRLTDVSGPITTSFCIDDIIYFDNESADANGYLWEFYDDNTGTSLLNTSTAENPTFSYSTAGQKLIRLSATNNAAQSNCTEQYEVIVNITPSLVAQIETRDLSNNLITPHFCQDPSNLQNFNVRFIDVSVGTITPTTEWRWEFYDENGILVQEEPGSGFSGSQLGPFDRTYTNVGTYTSRLIIRDAITFCENINETEVIIYENPMADFDADRVCEGNPTNFTDMSSLNSVNGESIVSWEWDFDYDGITFNKDPSFDNQVDFNRTYSSAGTYDVALRVVTDQNLCEDVFVRTITVDPLPIANISANVTSGCSVLNVDFTNNGIGSQPDVITEYIWEIDEGSGYVIDSIQSPTDPGFSSQYNRNFSNITTTDRVFDVRLRVRTQNGCEEVSNIITITVFPGPPSGFNELNYSPFGDNCSPISVDFEVGAQTQSLNPTDYTWTINDENGQIDQVSTGSIPVFSYDFENNTQGIKNYEITLSSTLSNSCTSDSIRLIRVNPVPQSGFTLDTLAFNCDLMEVRAEAIQKGSAIYNWTISENGSITRTESGPEDFIDQVVTKVTNSVDVDISLQTENIVGCQGLVVTQSYTVPAEINLTADFIADPLIQTLPNATVNITNNSAPGAYDYLWSFGDGNTSADPNLNSYTYETYGTYTITLTVSQDECVEMASQTITINPIPPILEFDFIAGDGCAPLTVDFINLSQYAEPDTYFWDFGDDIGVSRNPNPTYTYFEPGIYTVSLTASNITEDTITITKTDIIEVLEQPLASFEVRPNVVLVPDNPIYLSNRSQGASQFTWFFGDGNSSNDTEPTYYYEDEGVYDITLIAENISGCTDTLTRQGIVRAEAVGRLLIPNAFSPNPDGPTGGEAGGVPGTNDIFLPLSQQVVEFEMLIFNRWGELLFQSLDQNIGWDGYYNGRLQPQDVYVYKLNLIFENGEQVTRAGDVNLIR